MMAVDAVADLEDGPTEQVDDIYTTQDAILSTTECVQAPEPDGDRSCSVLSSTCSSGSMQIKRSAGFRTIPLTNDHRAGCAIECERLLRAGARVHPKRLPGGLEIGEPRMWLQHRSVNTCASSAAAHEHEMLEGHTSTCTMLSMHVQHVALHLAA